MADRVVKYVLQGQITDFQAKMAAASASTGKLANDLTGLDAKGAKMRQGLSSVGDAAGKIGLAAGAALGAVVLVTAKFEKQMSSVQAATGETGAAMDKLREAAIQAGADTAFSASEAAQGIEELAKAGVETSEILGGGLAGALDLAAAGQIGVGEAAEYSAKAMTMFGLGGKDVTHIADLLAAAAGKAVGEVGDFGQALNQAGLVASQTGLTIEDTVGTLAAFAQAGLQGSDAGTAFKSMLQRLQNPLGQGAKALETYGIAAYDANGNFVGITNVAQQLQDKLGGLDQATRDAAMSQIFGSDAVRAAAILYREGATGIQGWINKTNDAGFAAEQAAAKMDNLAGDFEEFMGSMETALIKTGDGSQGPLRKLVQGATDAVNAYSDLPPAAQGATVGILGVTAVVGGGIWAFSKLVQGVAGTKLALTQLGVSATATKAKLAGVQAFAAGPWGIGLAVAGVAAYALSTVNDELTASLEATAAALSDGVMPIDEQAAALDVARKSVKDYRAALDEVNLFDPAVFKNEIESWFGKSDIEEAEQALAKLEDQFHANRNEIQANDRALGDLSGVLDQNADGFVTNADAVIENTEALQDNIDAMEDLREANIRALDAEYAYAASLLDVQDRLEKRKELLAELKDAETVEDRKRIRKELENYQLTLDKTTRAGQESWQVLRNQAAAWNNLDGATQNAKGAFKSAKDELYNTARQFGATKAEARAYVEELLEIPPERVTTITADTSQALSAIGATRAALDALRDKRVIVTTQQHTIATSDRAIARAEGGAVYGPGTATSDSIPAYLSNGEYVVKAAAVQKYGTAMFDQLNAMRFADGGLVDPRHYARGGDVEPLTARDFRQFNLSGSSDVRREFEEFRRAVRDAGGEWTAQMARAARQALATSRAYEKHAKHLDKLTDRRNALASDVSGNFDNDPFGNGLSGAFMQLEADRNDSRTQTREMRRLRRLGLDGAAFQALSASGDLNTMSQINTRGEVRRLEQLFAERARAQNTSGQVATAEMTKTIRSLERQMKKQERTLGRLEGAVERGARRGVGDRGQTTQQRRRAGR